MIGIDLVKVSRIEQFVERFGERALQRFLHPDEIARSQKPKTIAGLWAAKEALSKALGCGIGESLGFHDMKIDKNDRGAPEVHFSDAATQRHGIIQASVSITHDGDYAVAAAMVVTADSPIQESSE